jgi:membrane protease subunit HflK
MDMPQQEKKLFVAAPGTPGPESDPAQESLVGALQSGFTVLRLIMIVLVVLYLLSGIIPVEPGEQAVVVRLGKLMINDDPASPYYETPVFGEGWIWWALPDPIDDKIRIEGNVRRLTSEAFLFQLTREQRESNVDLGSIRRGRELDPGVDGAMLTGDKNLSHGRWSIEYRISNAAQFVRNVADHPDHPAVDHMLLRLLDSAILREVSYRKVEEVTRTRRDVIANDVHKRLQREIDALDLGIAVDKVIADTIVPPQVASAFDAVTRAQNERQQQQEAALATATETLNRVAGPQHREVLRRIERYSAAQLTAAPDDELEELRSAIDDALATAQGEVAAMLRDAQAEANSVREQISREYEEFRNRLEQYRLYPQQTKIQLWTRMLSTVLGTRQNEVFWIPDTEVIEILVNRDPNREIELERERLMRDVMGQMQE